MAEKFNLEKLTLANKNYRKVLSTTPQQQLVLMSIKLGEDIGRESHTRTTQFIRIEGGTALVVADDKVFRLNDGDSVTIPPKTLHNVTNTSPDKDLKLYTIYSPPEHPKDLVQKNKPR